MWGGIGLVALVAAVTVILYLRSGHQTPVPDREIEKSIRAKFDVDPDLRKYAVNVKSENGVVTLTGFVDNVSDRSTASLIVLQQPGVKTVVDDLVLTMATQTSASAEDQADFGSATQSGSVRAITVPGNRPWTATGVFLDTGAVVKISASGGVSFSRGSKPGPPAGDLPDCLTVANGPYGWRAAPYVANQLPCGSLLARVGEQGSVFYVGAGTTFTVSSPGQLYLGVNDNNFGDNSGHWTAKVIEANPPSIANTRAIWFGFANGSGAQDRDVELRRNCGDFERVYVPENVGNKFGDLCGYLGKTCVKVCDWEGTSFSCDSLTRGRSERYPSRPLPRR